MREPKYLNVSIIEKKGQNSWSKGEEQALNIYEKYELSVVHLVILQMITSTLEQWLNYSLGEKRPYNSDRKSFTKVTI